VLAAYALAEREGVADGDDPGGLGAGEGVLATAAHVGGVRADRGALVVDAVQVGRWDMTQVRVELDEEPRVQAPALPVPPLLPRGVGRDPVRQRNPLQACRNFDPEEAGEGREQEETQVAEHEARS